MKHLLSKKTISILSVVGMVAPLSLVSGQAYAASVTTPTNLELSKVVCEPVSSASAMLTWEKQANASEYRVFKREEYTKFDTFQSTTSAEFKVMLPEKDPLYLAVAAASTPKPGFDGPEFVSEKSEEVKIDRKLLCPPSPTPNLGPINEKEIVLNRVEATQSTTPSAKPTEIAPTETGTPTPTLEEQVTTNERVKKLNNKYEESKKTQAVVAKKVRQVVKWIKSTIFFWE